MVAWTHRSGGLPSQYSFHGTTVCKLENKLIFKDYGAIFLPAFQLP